MCPVFSDLRNYVELGLVGTWMEKGKMTIHAIHLLLLGNDNSFFGIQPRAADLVVHPKMIWRIYRH